MGVTPWEIIVEGSPYCWIVVVVSGVVSDYRVVYSDLLGGVIGVSLLESSLRLGWVEEVLVDAVE